METTDYHAQEGTLFTYGHPDIKTQRNLRAILSGCTLTAISLAAFTGTFMLQKASPALSVLALVIGAILLSYAMFLIFRKSSHKIYTPTGSAVEEKTLFFETREKAALLESLESGEFYTSMLPLTTTTNGCIRLDVQRSMDGKFAIAQLLEYEPYTFHPVSPIYHYEHEQAMELGRYVADMR